MPYPLDALLATFLIGCFGLCIYLIRMEVAGMRLTDEIVMWTAIALYAAFIVLFVAVIL